MPNKIAAALLLALAVVGCGPERPHYYADFSSASNVNPYTEVLLAGVTVGKVTRVETTTALDDPIERAQPRNRVYIELIPELNLREGTVLTVKNRGPISEVVLSVTPGPREAPVLPYGSEVTRTRVAVRVEDLGELLAPVIEKMNPETMEQLTGYLAAAVSEPTDGTSAAGTLRKMSHMLDLISAVSDNNQANLRRLIDTLGKIQTELDFVSTAELEKILTDLEAAFAHYTSIKTKIDALMAQWGDQIPPSELVALRARLTAVLGTAEHVQAVGYLHILKQILQHEGASGGAVRKTYEQIQQEVGQYRTLMQSVPVTESTP